MNLTTAHAGIYVNGRGNPTSVATIMAPNVTNSAAVGTSPATTVEPVTFFASNTAMMTKKTKVMTVTTKKTAKGGTAAIGGTRY